MFRLPPPILKKTAASLFVWIGLVLIILYSDIGFRADRTEQNTAEATLETSSATSSPSLPRPVPELLTAKHSEIKGKLKNNEGFDDSMKRLGVSGDIRTELIKTFANTLDFKRLRPGDRYSIILDENKNLFACTYESGPLKIYTVKKTDSGFAAARVAIPLEVKTVRLTGTVDSSIFNAFLGQGEKAKLVHGFANIFASKIDFNTEPRPGDTFNLVIEKYFKNKDFVGYGKILVANYKQKDNDLMGFYFTPDDKKTGSHFDSKGNELRTSFLRSPIPFGRVTSRFTYKRKHPILNVTRPHLGIDLAAPVGTPIMAASDGRISFVGRNGGFGKHIIINHANGYQTHYGHLSRFAKGIKKGKRVQQKETIGYVGSTGLSTGPHLDYRIAHNGVFKNPFSLKFKPLSTLKGAEYERFSLVRDKLSPLITSDKNNELLQVREVTLSDNNELYFL